MKISCECHSSTGFIPLFNAEFYGEPVYYTFRQKKIFFFEKIVKVSSKNFKNSKNFFFAHRVQNRLKRRQNEFGRKKIFFKKSSVSTTSTLRKNFKNRKIFFSCIVFRMVQNVGKTSLSEKKFCRKNPLCVEDQNT